MSSFDDTGTTVRALKVNGITVNVATAGRGPAVLLLHGWPHTRRLWHRLIPLLAPDHRVIAPDLRGTGGTTRSDDGYDLVTLSDDAEALLDALEVDEASVVGIDLGVSIATMLALRRPSRVNRLIVMEGLVGALPGAERFLSKGPPWWFGFHAVPGLAETVLVGHEDEYISWFLRNGTADRQGIDEDSRRAFVAAYTGRNGLRGGFEHYRGFAAGARQLSEAVESSELRVPTLAIAGGVVGDATRSQLQPIAKDLSSVAIDRCGHLIPLEQPDDLARVLKAFLESRGTISSDTSGGRSVPHRHGGAP